MMNKIAIIIGLSFFVSLFSAEKKLITKRLNRCLREFKRNKINQIMIQKLKTFIDGKSITADAVEETIDYYKLKNSCELNYQWEFLSLTAIQNDNKLKFIFNNNKLVDVRLKTKLS